MITILNISIPFKNNEVIDQFLFRGDIEDSKYLPLLKKLKEELLEFGALWVTISQVGEESWRIYFSTIRSLPIEIGAVTKWLGI